MPSQAMFVREYVVDFNGTRAAIAAGYAEKSARVTASQLLTKPNISAEITRLVNDRSERLGITADYVLGTIQETVERCKQGEAVLDKEGNPTGEWRYDAFAVLKGCELLGKHLELFTEKVKHGGSIEHIDLSRLSDESLDEIEAIVESANTKPARHQG